MEAEVLHPAGMTHSGFYAFNDLPANTACGYLNDLRTSNIYQLPIRGGGDGGMYTTTADLHSFWHRLFADEIISPELRTQFLATHHAFGEKSGYGCGIYKELDDSAFSMAGEDAGVSFYSRYYPQKEIVVNMLSNTANGVGTVRKMLLEQVEQMR
ncbi:MAG: serine hydrolase [Candidatus Latescibacterota bacterium]